MEIKSLRDFVSETLMAALEDLEKLYFRMKNDEQFLWLEMLDGVLRFEKEGIDQGEGYCYVHV